MFLRVRGETGWSQQRLGAVVGLDQGQISALERGTSRLWNVRLVAGVAQGLRICGGLLNFPDFGVTVDATAGCPSLGIARRKVVSCVDRRDFGQHIAGLILGVAGAADLDIDRLISLLPQAEPAGARHIGSADVETIEQITAAYMRQDFAHGGGLIRDAADAQLRTVLPLLNAQVTPGLRPRLDAATARLAMQAGWISFECNHHEAARRLWMIGLDLARHCEHPQATDLTIFLLLNMADQSMHLGRFDEALHLTRIGETAAVGRHPVSDSTFSLLANIQARACADKGDAAGCDRALGQGIDHLSKSRPVTAPPYG
ncbi:MAG: hypothetical protein ACRDSH_21920, partial [Pseudonocardiaceae bacterium]